MIWRICAIVTEQSHVLKCRMFCIFISKVMSGFCVLSELTSCCFLCSDCRSYAVCGIWFKSYPYKDKKRGYTAARHTDSNPILTKIKREAILPQDTDFSVSCGSIASLFIFVRIGFEPCNNHYLAAFVLPGPAICFCGKMLSYLSRLFFS